MRVLLLAYYFPKPTNTTMGTWALEQAQAFRRAGMHVHVRSYTSWFPKLLAFHPGIRRYASCPSSHSWDGLAVDYPRWPLYPFEGINSLIESHPNFQLRFAWPFVRAGLFRAVEQFQPDVIFAHHTIPNGFLALKIHQRFDIPYVITDHAYDEVDDAFRFTSRRKVFQSVLSHASKMIGLSRRMSLVHQRLGTPPERTATICNGSDAPPHALDTQRPPELKDKLVITSVGMFYPRKGFPLLVRAFAQIANKHPTAVLRIVGDGRDRPAVEQAIRESGLANRITLCGLQPSDRVRQELAWSNLFALVSWNEPWGVVYNEAMAAGVPILCANDGGINDVLVHGQTALTVPPQDQSATAAALDQLLSDAPLRHRLGAAGRALFLSHLTWDANARQFAEIFANILRSRQPTPATTAAR